MTKAALAQPEQEQTGIREIRVTETVKQEQESVGEVNRHGRDSHGRQWHSIHWYDANVDVPHGTKLYTTPPKRPWVGLTDEQLLACTVHNRFEYDPPYINNVGETRVARHEVALRATYENINSKLKELNI